MLKEHLILHNMSKYTGVNLLDKIQECLQEVNLILQDPIEVSTTTITDTTTGTTVTVVTGVTVKDNNLGTKISELNDLYTQFHKEVTD